MSANMLHLGGSGSPLMQRPMFKELTNQENSPAASPREGKPTSQLQAAASGPLSSCDHPAPAATTTAVPEVAGVSAEEAWRSLSCGICSGWIASSLVLSCGHSFCGQCLFDWVNLKPSCPACQVGLRAVPVRSLALDAAVAVFERLLPEGERVDLSNRIELGRSAVNKLNKMLWWLQPPVMPALGAQDSQRTDSSSGGGSSNNNNNAFQQQQRDASALHSQQQQQRTSRDSSRRSSTGGVPAPPVTGRSHSFSGAHPPNLGGGGNGGGHHLQHHLPIAHHGSFSSGGNSSYSGGGGNNDGINRQLNYSGNGGGPRRSSPGQPPSGGGASGFHNTSSGGGGIPPWRPHSPPPHQQQQHHHQQDVRNTRSPLSDSAFLGLLHPSQQQQQQAPMFAPQPVPLSHQQQAEQLALLQQLQALQQQQQQHGAPAAAFMPSGRTSHPGSSAFDLPTQHSYGQLSMGGSGGNPAGAGPPSGNVGAMELGPHPLDDPCAGMPLDLENSYTHVGGVPTQGMHAEIENLLRNWYL